MSTQSLLPRLMGAAAAVSMWLAASLPAVSQSGACALVADERNPPQHILRCGDGLVVREAPGTRYHPVDQDGTAPPKALQLDAGALMIEFHPTEAQKDFQILTPHAIAAVRGTKWVVDVRSTRTSTLVLSGEVAVARPQGTDTVVLKPGEGVDVSAASPKSGAKSGHLAARRWPKARVQSLLARFGE